mmetsp:Transcript_78316/g.187764  ORF Transcript_78316/g.187764 Transcript_78316/m.187764 type:complete len:136 (-) Transcript_78316:92-499(-)
MSSANETLAKMQAGVAQGISDASDATQQGLASAQAKVSETSAAAQEAVSPSPSLWDQLKQGCATVQQKTVQGYEATTEFVVGSCKGPAKPTDPTDPESAATAMDDVKSKAAEGLDATKALVKETEAKASAKFGGS